MNHTCVNMDVVCLLDTAKKTLFYNSWKVRKLHNFKVNRCC